MSDVRLTESDPAAQHLLQALDGHKDAQAWLDAHRKGLSAFTRALGGGRKALDDLRALGPDGWDEVFETILKPRFAKQDPKMLLESWKVAQKAHAKDIRVNVKQLENSQKVSLVGKLLDPKDALTKYDDLFTDEFVK